MNSDMVKSKKLGHLHLVYYFTVPLSPNYVPKIGYQPSFWSALSPEHRKHVDKIDYKVPM